MANAIITHSNGIAISTLGAGWQTYNLASQLTHPNPKIVVIRFENTSGTTTGYGVRKAGGGAGVTGSLMGLCHTRACIALTGTQVDINKQTDNLDLFLEAEFGGDDVVVNDPMINEASYTENDWKTVTTADAGADGKNTSVIVAYQWTGVADGCHTRETGSTDSWEEPHSQAGTSFNIVRLNDSNQYDIWISYDTAGKGQTSWIKRVGYIRGWNHITNPVTLGVGDLVNNAETVFDLRTQGIGDHADFVLARVHQDFGSRQANTYVRDSNSTDTFESSNGGQNNSVMKIIDSGFTYRFLNVNIGIHTMAIHGWYPKKPQLRIDTGDLTLNTSDLTLR